MFDAMRFWLDRGVAGFRLDAITTLFEDPKLRNEPLTGELDASGFPESNHTLTSGLPGGPRRPPPPARHDRQLLPPTASS